MKTENRTPRRDTSCSGFTLIELMMAVTIMVVLLALGLQSVGAVKSSYELQASSSGLMSQLELARQMARTQNRKVEVRFYSDSAVTPPVYRAMGLFLMSADGTVATPFQKPFNLPDTVRISGDSTFSSLLPLCDKMGTDVKGSYRGFLFLPDGTMYTAGQSLPTLTLVPAVSRPVPAGQLPPNFATVQIDPKTGRTKFFRP